MQPLRALFDDVSQFVARSLDTKGKISDKFVALVKSLQPSTAAAAAADMLSSPDNRSVLATKFLDAAVPVLFPSGPSSPTVATTNSTAHAFTGITTLEELDDCLEELSEMSVFVEEEWLRQVISTLSRAWSQRDSSCGYAGRQLIQQVYALSVGLLLHSYRPYLYDVLCVTDRNVTNNIHPLIIESVYFRYWR